MQISRELEAKLLAMGGIYGPLAQTTTVQPEAAPARKAQLVTPGVVADPTRILLMVAFESKSETNLRDGWRGKSKRTQAARKAVREALGVHLGALEPFARHYAADGALRVKFTRFGVGMLDRGNIPAATKGVEDAIAYLLNADDGSPKWHPEWGQFKSTLVGVQIVVSMF